MRDLSTQAFLMAMDACVQQEVDFILFAGDLFNTSLPALDTLKIVTKELKKLKDRHIPVYVIAGSHDFSPSGKTMIDVLEHAGLLKNVCRGSVNPETKELHLQFTIDKKTGAKLTGILGRKGQLDRAYYEQLSIAPLEQEPGYKIFMFHTTISEMKPSHLQQIESHPASFLPKGFAYYAGGHIHHRTEISLPEYGTLTYPGALFPNNFAEVEKYGHGGFYLITTKNSMENSMESEPQEYQKKQEVRWIPVQALRHVPLHLDCNGKLPWDVIPELQRLFSTNPVQESIVTLRFSGTLAQGKIADIPFKEIEHLLEQAGARIVLRNTAELQTDTFGEVKITTSHPEQMEDEVIREHLQQVSLFDRETELRLTKMLLTTLHTQKREGETVPDFQRRIEQETENVLGIGTKKTKEI